MRRLQETLQPIVCTILSASLLCTLLSGCDKQEHLEHQNPTQSTVPHIPTTTAVPTEPADIEPNQVAFPEITHILTPGSLLPNDTTPSLSTCTYCTEICAEPTQPNSAETPLSPEDIANRQQIEQLSLSAENIVYLGEQNTSDIPVLFVPLGYSESDAKYRVNSFATDLRTVLNAYGVGVQFAYLDVQQVPIRYQHNPGDRVVYLSDEGQFDLLRKQLAAVYPYASKASIIVVQNSMEYFGGGKTGWAITSGEHLQSLEIALHEFLHSRGLDDLYYLVLLYVRFFQPEEFQGTGYFTTTALLKPEVLNAAQQLSLEPIEQPNITCRGNTVYGWDRFNNLPHNIMATIPRDNAELMQRVAQHNETLLSPLQILFLKQGNR